MAVKWIECSKCGSRGIVSAPNEEETRRFLEKNGGRWIAHKFVCALCTGLMEKMLEGSEGEYGPV